MLGRAWAKRILMRSGLYYPARAAYRRLNPEIVHHQELEAQFYRALIAPGDLCFDVGAHLGVKVEALLEAGARVVAIEPEPTCIGALTEKFASHPRVDLVKRGVAAQPGRATLHRRPDTLSMTSLREDWGYGAVESVEIELTTLDGIIQAFGVPKYIKVDVEGFETEVFKGLTRHVPLISFEFHLEELERARSCLSLLSQLGAMKVNVTPVDSPRFLFPAWLTVEQLLAEVEGGWQHGPRGDIYVSLAAETAGTA